MNESKQFVIYPHEEQEFNGLTPADKLIYLVIRRYMNQDSMSCYVSYTTITRDCGAAAKTIKKCVDNLVKEGYLETKRDGKRIVYKFNNKKKFEPFSYDFLDNPNLTFTEKSYIVASQQYMYKEGNEGKISYTNRELSRKINMSESTISRCNYSLERKGYLEGADKPVKVFQARELDLLFIEKFKDIDTKVNKNTEDIEILKKKIAQLEEENKALKENRRNNYVL